MQLSMRGRQMLSKDVCNICRRELKIMNLVQVPYESLWNCVRTGELVSCRDIPPDNCVHKFEHGVYSGTKSVNIDKTTKS